MAYAIINYGSVFKHPPFGSPYAEPAPSACLPPGVPAPLAVSQGAAPNLRQSNAGGSPQHGGA